MMVVQNLSEGFGFDNRYIDNKAKRNSRQTPFYPAVTSRKLLIDFY